MKRGTQVVITKHFYEKKDSLYWEFLRHITSYIALWYLRNDCYGCSFGQEGEDQQLFSIDQNGKLSDRRDFTTNEFLDELSAEKCPSHTLEYGFFHLSYRNLIERKALAMTLFILFESP